MCGLARPGDLVALDAEGADHGAEREIHRLEHRALLDVQLEVGGRVLELPAGVLGAVEIDAVLAQRVGQRDAVRVDAPAQLVLVVHRPRARARAEEAAPEARALLVRPVDEPDGHLRLALLGEAAHHLDAGQHVQAAVEPAAVRDGVHVAADQQLPLRAAAQREPLVARLVDLVLEREAGELAAQPLAAALPGLRPRDALRAVLVARELAELAKLVHGAARLERHGPMLTAPSGVIGNSDGDAAAASARAGLHAASASAPGRVRPRCCSSCWPCSGGSGSSSAGRARRSAPPRPFTVNERTLPHLHDIVGTLASRRGANGPMLIEVLWDAALVTAKEAAVGFAMGASIGFLLGVVLVHSRLLQRGFLPYIVASQTVPILAIAPMVVVWLGGRGLARAGSRWP